MATLLAHIQVKKGREAEFEAIAAELHRETHANEAPCLRYEYWRGADERTYYVLLSFDDYRGFLAHQSADHHEAEVGPIGDAVESLRLEWVDPIAGASPLEPTDMQSAPDDASDLAKQYSQSHPADVQAWWAHFR